MQDRRGIHHTGAAVLFYFNKIWEHRKQMQQIIKKISDGPNIVPKMIKKNGPKTGPGVDREIKSKSCHFKAEESRKNKAPLQRNRFKLFYKQKNMF